ncbi:hypothetical protein HNR74_002564 [Flammeovirga kamogawensis]|nr:hypothetical protein [Flammeovirga kamogawensis]
MLTLTCLIIKKRVIFNKKRVHTYSVHTLSIYSKKPFEFSYQLLIINSLDFNF